jgi:predicted ATPase/DNA-binding XRE family transcriptional regulator
VPERSDREFGGLLRRFRLAAGFSQEALAERAGLSADAIAALERGRRSRPRPYTVRLLADALRLEQADRAALIEVSVPRTEAAGAEPDAPPVDLLPVQLTTFIGRELELKELREQLRVVRLLTLTGAGGTGKTRLAIELAALLVRDGEGPVWFAALDCIREPDLVVPTVAAALGVREERGRSALEMLELRLRDSSDLVILDNCEHLVEAVGSLVQALLQGCPGLRVLATSRSVLGLPSELTWRVPSLRLPAPATAYDLTTLAGVEAVQLFVERATFADPAFRLNAANAAAVVGICRWLDGIPLAIELAAARARVLAPAQMLARLEDASSLLTAGSQMAVARQRTLRATIEWSYQLLEPGEQKAFDRLSVFAGGFELEAAEAVAGDGVLDTLASLVDQSLVIAEPGRAGTMRYRLQEVLRQFGQGRLTARGEDGEVLLRHADYYTELAETAEPELTGAGQLKWVARLRRERDNLRAVLAWSQRGRVNRAAAGPTGPEYLGLRLAAALWFFWYADGALIEGRHWLETVCAAHDGSSGGPRSQGLTARALAGAGWLAFVQSQPAEAAALAESSLELVAGADEPVARVNAWSTLGAVAIEGGDYDRAADLFRQALEVARGNDLGWWIGASLNNLGFLSYRRGDLEAARRLIEEGEARKRAMGDALGVASSLVNLGAIGFAEGDVASAFRQYLEALRLLQQLGSTSLTAELLEDLAGVLVARGRPELATRVFSSAVAYRAAIGAPAYEWRQPTNDRTIAQLQDALGPETYESTWLAGSRLSIDEAVREVLTAP